MGKKIKETKIVNYNSFVVEDANSDIRKAQSTLEIIKLLTANEGFSTLYRGIVPVLQSLCISNFVYFYTFHSLKTLAGIESQSAVRDLFLGTIAGVVNVMTTTPFWVVNTRLKTMIVRPYTNLINGLFYIWKTEGIQGLWAGAVPSLMLVSNPALQFMMYEALKRRVAKLSSTPSAITFFLIGALAKTFATCLTYPLQLIQTKLRHGHKTSDKPMGNLSPNTGVIQMLLTILKANGFAGLFVGLEAKLLQTVLTAALMFTAYEKIANFVMTLLIRKSSGHNSRI